MDQMMSGRNGIGEMGTWGESEMLVRTCNHQVYRNYTQLLIRLSQARAGAGRALGSTQAYEKHKQSSRATHNEASLRLVRNELVGKQCSLRLASLKHSSRSWFTHIHLIEPEIYVNKSKLSPTFTMAVPTNGHDPSVPIHIFWPTNTCPPCTVFSLKWLNRRKWKFLPHQTVRITYISKSIRINCVRFLTENERTCIIIWTDIGRPSNLRNCVISGCITRR